MPDVVFNLTAEEGAAVSAFLKLTDTVSKTERGLRGMSDAAKAGAEAMKATAGEAEQKVSSLGESLEAVTGVVGAVTAAVAAFGAIGSAVMDDMSAKTDALRDRINILQQQLALTGEIKLLPQVEAAVKSISDNSKTMNDKDVSQLFAQVHRDSKGKLSTEQEIDAVTASVNMADAGGGAEGAGIFARTRVALQKNLLANASSSSLNDATSTFLQSNPQGIDTQQERFINLAANAKISPDKVLEMLAAASRGGAAGKKTLEEFLQTSERDIKVHESSMETSPETKAKIEALRNQTLDIDKELHGDHVPKFKQRKLTKDKERIEDQIHELELNKSVKQLSAEQQSDNALAAFAPGEDRLAAMFSNPDSLQPKLRLAMKAMSANLRPGEFSKSGGFGQTIQAHQDLLAQNPEYADAQMVAERAKQTANIHDRPDEDARKAALLKKQFEQNLEASPYTKAFLETVPYGKSFGQSLYGATHKVWDKNDKGLGSGGVIDVRIVNGGNRPVVKYGAGNARESGN